MATKKTGSPLPVPPVASNGLHVGEWSVRTAAVGGVPAAAVQTGATPPGWSGRRLVIVLHGYNNSLSEARDGYATFREQLADTVLPPDVLQQDFRWFFWPGDESTPFDAAAYPAEILRAKTSARRLGEHLVKTARDLNSSIDVFLVGHSLGCRVVLELLHDFATHKVAGPVTFKGICLMAAAVPTYKMEHDEFLRPAARLCPSRVLFSPQDSVLRKLFPWGQLAEGSYHGMPEAVGLLGHPGGVWTQTHNCNLDHSGYFASPECAGHVADMVLARMPGQAIV